MLASCVVFHIVAYFERSSHLYEFDEQSFVCTERVFDSFQIVFVGNTRVRSRQEGRGPEWLWKSEEKE